MAEVESKECIRFDKEKLVCNKQFKKMTDAVIKAVTDSREEFKRNKDAYSETVKEGLDMAKNIAGYSGKIRARDYIGYLRDELGGVGWKELRGETARKRLKDLGFEFVEEKGYKLPEKEWEKVKEMARKREEEF